MSAIRRLFADRNAATAAEFTLVLPLLLILLFAIVDGARYMWEHNRIEKATQVGARVAVVTDVIPAGLAAANYVGVGGLTQGDVIPASALGKMVCTRTACCDTLNPCTTPHPTPGTINSGAFDLILTRMKAIKPDLTAANVRVEYRGSGLGFAGDPNGMEVSPLVTVRVTGLTFRPITSLILATITMPDLSSTLTAEDSSGSQSF